MDNKDNIELSLSVGEVTALSEAIGVVYSAYYDQECDLKLSEVQALEEISRKLDKKNRAASGNIELIFTPAKVNLLIMSIDKAGDIIDNNMEQEDVKRLSIGELKKVYGLLSKKFEDWRSHEEG